MSVRGLRRYAVRAAPLVVDRASPRRLWLGRWIGGRARARRAARRLPIARLQLRRADSLPAAGERQLALQQLEQAGRLLDALQVGPALLLPALRVLGAGDGVDEVTRLAGAAVHVLERLHGWIDPLLTRRLPALVVAEVADEARALDERLTLFDALAEQLVADRYRDLHRGYGHYISPRCAAMRRRSKPANAHGRKERASVVGLNERTGPGAGMSLRNATAPIRPRVLARARIALATRCSSITYCESSTSSRISCARFMGNLRPYRPPKSPAFARAALLDEHMTGRQGAWAGAQLEGVRRPASILIASTRLSMSERLRGSQPVRSAILLRR